MIRDWRRAWGQGDFPFLQVQLANFGENPPQPGASQWAELRDAQFRILEEVATGMAVTIDIGEALDMRGQTVPWVAICITKKVFPRLRFEAIHGRSAVLHNAVIEPRQTFEKGDVAFWMTVFQINLFTAVSLIRCV